MILFAASPEVSRGLSMLSKTPGSDAGVMHVVLSMLAWVLLCSGAYAVRGGARTALPHMAAAVGGGLYCLILLIPIGSGVHPLVAPFKMLGSSGSRGVLNVFGLTLIVSLGLAVTAAILSFQLPRRRGDVLLATMILRLVIISVLIMAVPAVFGALAAGDNLFFVILLAAIKAAAWLGGLYVAAVLGAAEVMVTAPSGAGMLMGNRPSGGGDATERMRHLNALLAQGLISREEFERKRREVLGGL
jgi:hypothetical protein